MDALDPEDDDVRREAIKRIMDRIRAEPDLQPPAPPDLETLARLNPDWLEEIESDLRTANQVIASGELKHVRKQAENGVPSSMRRMAEIMQLLAQPAEARQWWHKAAAAGDQDAIDMCDYLGY